MNLSPAMDFDYRRIPLTPREVKLVDVAARMPRFLGIFTRALLQRVDTTQYVRWLRVRSVPTKSKYAKFTASMRHRREVVHYSTTAQGLRPCKRRTCEFHRNPEPVEDP